MGLPLVPSIWSAALQITAFSFEPGYKDTELLILPSQAMADWG